MKKKIAFLCDINIPNYKKDPKFYDYLEGKHSATGYYYWILKNHGTRNIYLVNEDEDLTKYDIVVFHYDNKNKISTNSNYKTIQVVSDCPQVPDVDIYVCCNYSSFEIISTPDHFKRVGFGLKNHLIGNLHYIHYPMALNYKKCNPQWPPKIYHFTGRQSTLVSKIYSDEFVNHMRSKGVNLRFDFENDHNKGDEDVYFCIRHQNYFSNRVMGNNCDTKLGQKTANRLYQSWKMGTPFITNSNTAMCSIYKSKYDFLIADDADEFEFQCIRLKNDKELFDNMVKNANERKDEHTDSIIVDQWKSCFKKINQLPTR